MKKRIIIISSVFIIIAIIGTTTFLYIKNNPIKLQDKDTKISTTDKVESNKDDFEPDKENEDIIDESIAKENITTDNIDNDNSNTTDKKIKNEDTPKTSNNTSNNSSGTQNNSQSNSSTGNTKQNDERPKNNTTSQTQQPSKKEIWEELGLTEDQYYNKPMFSWQTIHYNVNNYGTREATESACRIAEEKYAKENNGGFKCENVMSPSGRYLGEMATRW